MPGIKSQETGGSLPVFPQPVNVADMTEVLASMAKDGHRVTPELVACLSPYTREHIRRFGQYALDMDDLPAPLDPQPLPFQPAL